MNSFYDFSEQTWLKCDNDIIMPLCINMWSNGNSIVMSHISMVMLESSAFSHRKDNQTAYFVICPSDFE